MSMPTKLFDNQILERHLIDKKQLSSKLSISVKTIDKLMAKKEIPFIKIGKSVRFDMKDIEEWLKQRSH